MKDKTIKIYDSTLRDGEQTKRVSFSIDDKLRIIEILTDIGVDYIEAGWPGANPTDDKLFKTLSEKFRSKVVAFGMMRKKGQSASNDPGLNAVLNSGVPTTCLVGKSWEEIQEQVWTKPDDDVYFFKKSHAYSYAMAIIVQLNKIVIDLSSLTE